LITSKIVSILLYSRALQEGGCRAATLPQKPPKPKFKTTDFVDIMISKVLHDLPFSRNQLLKSADDYCITIFKKLINEIEKKQDDRTL
jgi:hypothetical protein